jgi:hypothetical protein
MNSAFLCLMSGKSKNDCGDKIPTVHKTHSKHQEESLFHEEDSMSTSRQTIELAQVYCSNTICPAVLNCQFFKGNIKQPIAFPFSKER